MFEPQKPHVFFLVLCRAQSLIWTAVNYSEGRSFFYWSFFLCFNRFINLFKAMLILYTLLSHCYCKKITLLLKLYVLTYRDQSSILVCNGHIFWTVLNQLIIRRNSSFGLTMPIFQRQQVSPKAFNIYI